ncbi:hemicentin-1-like [Epinephelus lanceolatus]
MCFMFSEVTQIRGAAMSLTAAASGFVVFLLSVPVIQGQSDWGVTYTSTEICAVKGSTVEIHCSYRYPSRKEDKTDMVKTKFWFAKVSNKEPVDLKIDRDYTGRVQYLFRDDYCILRITDLRESDAAVYKFRFTTHYPNGYTGSPGVTLSVTDLQVLVEGSSTWAELKCHSRCNVAGHTPHVWYNNGEKLEEETSSHSVSVNDDGSYSCAVKGHEDHRSPPVYAPKLPSVSVSPSAEIVEGSSVTLTCSSDANPAAKYTWYKNGNLRPLSEEPQLVFSSIQSSDSGQYYCTAENKLGTTKSRSISINVEYAPKLSPMSVSPSGEIRENREVTLTCSSDANPAATYTWYKENGNLRPLSEEPQLVFSSIQSFDSGEYYCTAENKLGRRTSNYIPINVKYAPKLSPVSVSPSPVVKEGSSVTLTCSSDANPAAKYTWYKDGNPISLSEEPQLVFSSIQSFDSGEYYCTAENKLGRETSDYISINVKYAPKLSPVSVSPSPVVKEGSSVTLTCSSDANPAAKYTWYKDGNPISLSEEPQLVFSSIQSFDSGEYYCTAENKLGRETSDYISINVKYAPKLPSVSVSPSAEIVEGNSVTLTCSSDANPAANYTWYKDGDPRPLSEEPQLVFSSIQSSDSGQYYCTAQNELGRRTSTPGYISINVKYAPKLSPVSVSPSGEIRENSDLTLTCSSDANPAATYTWYKKNRNAGHPPSKQTWNTQSSRNQLKLVLRSIRSSDSGEYFCTAENRLGKASSQSININVKYAPKLPSVSVSPSPVVKEGSSVTLTCSSDANPAATYTWYKDGNALDKKVIKKIKSSDSGRYHCVAENEVGKASSQSIIINVKCEFNEMCLCTYCSIDAPKLPSVSVSPSAEIVEGSSVTLTCSSDANPAAKYTWYKDGYLRPLSEGPQLVFRSIQSSDSGQYYCTAQNELGTSTPRSISINVKYAPKSIIVSVSPSGEIRENSDVTLTCRSDANPAATYTWYKDGKALAKKVIKKIKSSDSGHYHCVAENKVGKASSQSIIISVKYAPKLPSVSVSPSGDVEEGSSVTLTCSSDANPAAKYTWYKKNGNVKPLSEERQLVLRSIQSSDYGQYYCTADNRLGRRTSYITINVKYAPKLPSVSVSPSAEIVEGSSVTLTCSSDANPAAKFTWHKNGNPGLPPSKQTQIVQSSRNQSKLIFSSVQPSDSGEYNCTAENKVGRTTSKLIFIDVKLQKLPSVSVSPSAEIVEGSSVTLTCSSDANPAATYTWYKENQTLIQGPEGIYRFTSISSEDRGSYHCKSENQHGQINSSALFVNVHCPPDAPKLPSVSVSPSAEIVEGSSVTLTCSSDANPAANYTWYKENKDSPKASGQIFTITDIRAEHSGNYYCEAQNSRGRHNSTIYLAAVAGSWILISTATVSAVVLAIILISVFLWIMKKRASKHPSGETPDTREQLQLAEQPNELHYATVRFSKNPAQPRRYVEAENVVYAVVKCDNASLASRSDQEAVEDSAALYSTVNKKRNL